MANLSIMGLYNYNNSVFDGFNVPMGIDRETCITEICLECAELEIIYPSFNTMKLAITNWSKIEQPIWQKLFDTEKLKYNPIWNVDADIQETHTTNRNKTGNDNRSSTANGTGSDNVTKTGQNSEQGNDTKTGTGTISGTNESTKSNPGYNSTSLVTTEKVNGSDTQNSTTTETNINNRTEQNSETENRTTTSNNVLSETGNNTETEDVTNTDTIRRTGNIGTTTTQSMILEERNVDQFSTIKYIVNSFKKRFCLLVY